MDFNIIERESFQVVGIKREFLCGAGDAGIPGVPEYWLESSKNGTFDQLFPLHNGEIPGLLGVTDNFNPVKNVVDYWIAVEHNGDVPSGLASIVFPASKWVVFEVRGPIPSAMINAWQQIYSGWFKVNGFEPAAKIAPIEAYFDPDLDSPNSLNQIWVAIK
ncbi:GyrI-like domain-containing protein [Bacillus sp. 1NLA3E]|uniref:GyrI-like domain-containing protein n=1 Tax=Bacillus sp. 1NLA3E TaxID=666686 RepID=UPI000247E616|nr:GyrI-like domain-containing protein [Bacillus sp. 1NLA3E]AGK53756.1 transcription activator effector binding protein [Bacillus sp. 1NLA3E]